MDAADKVSRDFAAHGLQPPLFRVADIQSMDADIQSLDTSPDATSRGEDVLSLLGAPFDAIVSDPPYDMRAAVCFPRPEIRNPKSKPRNRRP